MVNLPCSIPSILHLLIKGADLFLSKSFTFPLERITYFEKADQSLVGAVHCGVMFILTYSHSRSHEAFFHLTDLLDQIDSEGRLQFFVLDAEGLPRADHSKDFPYHRSGKGETAWIKDGKLLTWSPWKMLRKPIFASNTVALLAEQQGERPIMIRPLRVVSADLFHALLRSSLDEGFEFISKLVLEWESAKNRFDQRGEILLGAFWGAALIGVCGLNVDPYAKQEDVGRVRHLYVLPTHRGRGIGQQLIGLILGAACSDFRMMRLRTDNASAARFYEHLGFQAVSQVEACTHFLNLRE